MRWFGFSVVAWCGALAWLAVVPVEIVQAKVLHVQYHGYGQVIGPRPVGTGSGVIIFVCPENGCNYVSNDYYPTGRSYAGAGGFSISSNQYGQIGTGPRVFEFRQPTLGAAAPSLTREQIQQEILHLQQELQHLESGLQAAPSAAPSDAAGSLPPAVPQPAPEQQPTPALPIQP